MKFDERSALDQWIAAKDQGSAKPALIEAPATQPAKGATVAAAVIKPAAMVETPKTIAEVKPYKTLRDYLVLEVSERLNLPAEQLQIHFNPADERVLSLTEPHFEFNVNPPRNKNLGEVTWDVTIVADGTNQKTTVTANLKAWQSQIIVNKPLGYRQMIREDDVIERRILVDRLNDDPLVTREQVVGQMAGRDLKLGSVLTARLIDPTILVKSGQLVSITLIGQTIRVKNEVTNNLFDVVVTGPQTAKLPPSGAADKPGVAVLDR